MKPDPGRGDKLAVAAREDRPTLTIFFQFNPWGRGIGGIDTLIRMYVKYAPEVFILRIVGVGDPSEIPGRWRTAELSGRPIEFMPLFVQSDGNFKPRVPNSLRYTLALSKKNLSSEFMHFHRIEPGLVVRKWAGEKTLFFHIDIERQLYAGGGKNEFLWRRWPRAYLAMERNLIGRFDHILECNSASLNFHKGRYPTLADRFAFVKNCVDADVHFPLSEEARDLARRQLACQLGLDDHTRFVLFAGRLQPMKDPLLLLRAFAAVEIAGIHLLVAGDGNMRSAMETEIVALKLQTKVTLLGALEQGSLARLQRTASVFALTSAYEGLPLVVLEALACGTPVVATRAGETPALVLEGCGLVADNCSAEAVSLAIRHVLNYPARFPSFRCVAAAAPFSASVVLGAIYEEMLARRKVRGRIWAEKPAKALA